MQHYQGTLMVSGRACPASGCCSAETCWCPRCHRRGWSTSSSHAAGLSSPSAPSEWLSGDLQGDKTSSPCSDGCRMALDQAGSAAPSSPAAWHRTRSLLAPSPGALSCWLKGRRPLPISCLSSHFIELDNTRANRIMLVVNEGCSFVLLCALY